MKDSYNISQQVFNVLARIGLFLFYYVGLIALGLFIIWGVYKASYFVIGDALPEVDSVRLLIIIVVSWIGICLFALMFGAYLIKPLFSFHKNENDKRVEVTEEECPKLFTEIQDIAKNVGTQMPKHVYLTTDVNACVFYNTSFWSIFFPVRKNLEIGLGLFDGMSIDEVKAILAHEFGHFSQKSMKVGSTVYITNNVLYNLIYQRDQWDELVDQWATSSLTLWAFFGCITRGVTNQVKKLTFQVYKIVQKSYMKLSRQMEFDADSISCEYIGSNNFISAMCKVEVLAERDSRYQRFLKILADENKIVGNYFVGLNEVEASMPSTEHIELSYDKPLLKPVVTSDKTSHLSMENVWDSHPSIEDRLENAAQFPSKKTASVCAAWDMIPNTIKSRVSDQTISAIRMNVENKLNPINDEEFMKWAKTISDYNFMPSQLKPFFDRRIVNFDYRKTDEKDKVDNPFTQTNADFLNHFESSLADYRQMCGIANGQIEAQNIHFEGKVYEPDNLPIEPLKKQLDKEITAVKEIDQNVYLYMQSKCDEKQSANLKFNYHCMFYSYWMLDEKLQDLETYRDSLYEELTKAVRRNEDDFAGLCMEVHKYEDNLQKIVKSSDPQCMSLILDDDQLGYFNDFVNKQLYMPNSLDNDYLNSIFNMTQAMINIHHSLLSASRKNIIAIAKELDL